MRHVQRHARARQARTEARASQRHVQRRLCACGTYRGTCARQARTEAPVSPGIQRGTRSARATGGRRWESPCRPAPRERAAQGTARGSGAHVSGRVYGAQTGGEHRPGARCARPTRTSETQMRRQTDVTDKDAIGLRPHPDLTSAQLGPSAQQKSQDRNSYSWGSKCNLKVPELAPWGGS